MSKLSIVEDDYWERVHNAAEDGLVPVILFQDLFDQYLPYGGKCFEVGCYPGNYLHYLAKKFNYEVSGIDISPSVEKIRERFDRSNIQVGELKRGDFLEYVSEKRYDVVCSFGFVEHFADVDSVLQKHVDLVKPGGYLVVSCPNFTGVQHILHALLDGSNLRNHNIGAMNPVKWKRVLKRNQMQLLHHGYYQTFGFWVGSVGRFSGLRSAVGLAISGVARVSNSLIDAPSRLMSPHIISISRKPGEGGGWTQC